MANQELSLMWYGYQNNLLSNVKELYKDEGLSDVTLVSDGHSFTAHKVILSANSLVFRSLFQQNRHKDPIILLHDINAAALRILLTFMYNGEANVTEEFLPVLLKTAEALKIFGLSEGSKVAEDAGKNTTNSQPLKRKINEHENAKNKMKKPNKPPAIPDMACNVDYPDSDEIANVVPKEETVQFFEECTIDTTDTYIGNETEIVSISDILGSKQCSKWLEPEAELPVNTTSCDQSENMESEIEVQTELPVNTTSCDQSENMESEIEVQIELPNASYVDPLSLENLDSLYSDPHKNCSGVTGQHLAGLSDDDTEIEEEDCRLPPIIPPRNASAEFASVNNLTPSEVRALEVEDAKNDRTIRELLAEDCKKFEWFKERANFTSIRETFTGPTPGPTFEITAQTSTVDVFNKMIDTDFLDLLCRETNRYAKQKIALLKDQNKLGSNSRLLRWTDTNRNEMVIFLTLTILQELYPLPKEEAYFSFNGFGTMPYFARIMSYNRYQLLKSLLHFVDNEALTNPTKLSKILPITDYFNEKFSTLFCPSQNIAIDESLLPWHGRLCSAQKIKLKDIGIKTYELCDSSTGYLWKFYVYEGKEKNQNVTENDNQNNDNTDTNNQDDETNSAERQNHDLQNNNEALTVQQEGGNVSRGIRPSNSTAKRVYDLVSPILNRGHTLVLDNFYNSPLLARCLKNQKTDCVGTLRLSRECVPPSLKQLNKTDLRPGEIVASYCSDLAVMVWRDANLVSMISTYHPLQICINEKSNQVPHKPSIVLDYNNSMGGLDRKDRFLATQPTKRLRNRVWYKELFRYFYSTAIFNCFILFSSQNKTISYRQFKTTLAEDLMKIHKQIDLTVESRIITQKREFEAAATTRLIPNTRKATNRVRPFVEHEHFPVRTGRKRSRCSFCAERKLNSRTVWKCLECEVNLCIEICFRAYHKQGLVN